MKLRVRLAKTGTARYTSHLDLQRNLERVLRRAELPLAYSQGFSPHPKIAFASALATGTSSEGEFVDVDLTEEMAPEEFITRANRCSPPGLTMLEARIAPPGKESLFSLIDVAEYRLTVAGASVDALCSAVAAFLSSAEVIVEKEGKKGPQPVNIRDQVLGLSADGCNLQAFLQSGAQGSLKPELLLTGLVQVEPALSGARLADSHRVMLYRRDQVSGKLRDPWEL